MQLFSGAFARSAGRLAHMHGCSACVSAYGLAMQHAPPPVLHQKSFFHHDNGYGERRRGTRAKDRANINHHDAPPSAKLPMWGSWAVADDGGTESESNSTESGTEDGSLKMPDWATATAPATVPGSGRSRRQGWGDLAGSGDGGAGPPEKTQQHKSPTDVAGRKVRLEEAAKVLREGLVQRHSGTLQNKSNYAAVLEGQGKLGQAAELYREVVEGCNRSLGATNLSTLTAKNNLATILIQTFKEHAGSSTELLKESAELFKELHTTQVEALGATHPHTLASQQKWEVAVALLEEGKY